jgi:hypothetical protein
MWKKKKTGGKKDGEEREFEGKRGRGAPCQACAVLDLLDLQPLQTLIFFFPRCLLFLSICKQNVTTPTGHQYVGVEFSKKLCGVSIIRSGEAMENALR